MNRSNPVNKKHVESAEQRSALNALAQHAREELRAGKPISKRITDVALLSCVGGGAFAFGSSVAALGRDGDRRSLSHPRSSGDATGGSAPTPRVYACNGCDPT